MDNKIIKLQKLLLEIFKDKKLLLKHSAKIFGLYELISMLLISFSSFFYHIFIVEFVSYYFNLRVDRWLHITNITWHSIIVWLIILPVSVNFAKNNLKPMYIICYTKTLVAIGCLIFGSKDMFVFIANIIGTINSIFGGIIFSVLYFKRNYSRTNNQF